MKKAIMISICPEWVAKILNGEKTIELRKTMPTCELPTDVYIYVTKKTKQLFYDTLENKYRYGINRKNDKFNSLNCKIVAKFTLNRVEDLKPYMYSTKDENFYDILDKACLTTKDVSQYQNITQTDYLHETKKSLYSWHIDDLQIFKESKELSDFKKLGFGSELDDFIKDYKWNVKNMPLDMAEDEQNSYEENCNIIKENYKISKAPKSWCYAEVEKNGI